MLSKPILTSTLIVIVSVVFLLLPFGSVNALKSSTYFAISANASQQGACSGLSQLGSSAVCSTTAGNKPITNI